MTYFSCGNLPTDLCFKYVWQDYGVWIQVTVAVVFALAVFLNYRRTHRPNPNVPLSTHDSFDKSGLVAIREVEPDQEGASFFSVERENGEIENHQIGQPFTFFMENSTIERHHLNPRGAFPCLDPKYMTKGYVPNLNEITRIAALTEQHIRNLRTGGFEAKNKHTLRMLILLFLLAGCMGLGIAAATYHPPVGP